MAALKPTDTVGVIGAGTMGAGVAQVAAAAGHVTLLYDADPDAVARGIERVTAGLDKQVARGRMTAEQRDHLLTRIRPATDLRQLADAALVIEAIVENLVVKQELFARLESLCRPDTILASNTSSLSITAIGAALSRPGNLAGMHFFNPAPVMKLVEIVSGLATDPGVAAMLHDTAAAWNKQPVRVRSTPGFIVNRVARPFYAEALRLLEEGAADPATLDAIMREVGGFPMGPFELMDLIGHDVNFAVTRSVFSAYFNDPRFLPSLTQQELVEGGFLGRKSGRGFYDYGEGTNAPPVRTEPHAAPPRRIHISGRLGIAEPLAALWERAGIGVKREPGGDGVITAGDARITLTDGRTATRRAYDADTTNTVVFDLALDYAAAPRIALAVADQAEPGTRAAAAGLFQALGKTVSVTDDVPGLAVMRTVCMLANEGADAVLQHVCDARSVDIAMQAGVNYPRGPLAWADAIGPHRVLAVIENLQRAYGLDRYRPSPLLRRVVEGGGLFHP